MTSRKQRSAMACLLALLAMPWTAPSAAPPEAAPSSSPAAAIDAGWILSKIARPAPTHTDFVELRGSKLLKAPLRIEGQYSRPADDTLVRAVHAPYVETTTIRNGEARIERKALKAPRVGNATKDDLEKSYRAALRSLQSVDDLVAAVIAALKDTGKLDNTVVIYTSDNGFLFGDHRLIGKTAAYEGSIKVPLLMRGPGIPEHQSRDQLVNNLDVTATIVDLAGAKPGVPLDGKSLVPLFTDAGAGWRSALLVESPATRFDKKTNRYAGVRTATKKYVRYEGGFEELFDLASDPYELKNEVGSSVHAADLSTLRGIHDTLKSCAGESCWVP